MSVGVIIAVVALALFGALLTLLNFHLSFTWPLWVRVTRRPQPAGNASGIPLFGSASLWLAAGLLWTHDARTSAAWLLALSALDTAGLHWLFASLGIRWLRELPAPAAVIPSAAPLDGLGVHP